MPGWRCGEIATEPIRDDHEYRHGFAIKEFCGYDGEMPPNDRLMPIDLGSLSESDG